MDDSYTTGAGAPAPPPYLADPEPATGVSERMQSMLSQAAEDQLTEQRQLQAMVAEIRGELTAVSTELRATTGMLADRLEAIARAVASGAQATQALGTQFDRVVESLATQQQALAALPQVISRQASTTQPIEELRVHLGTAFVELRDQLTAPVAGLRAELDALRREHQAATVETARHVDEAVVALAEALLRRNRLGSAAAAPRPAAPAPPRHAAAPAEPPAAPEAWLPAPPVVDPGGEGAGPGPTGAQVAWGAGTSAADVPDLQLVEDAAPVALADDEGEPVSPIPPLTEVPGLAPDPYAVPPAADPSPTEAEAEVEADFEETDVPQWRGPDDSGVEAGTDWAPAGTVETAGDWPLTEETAPEAGAEQRDADAEGGEVTEAPSQEKRRPWWRPGG